jgi:ribosome biogenesis GTPase
MDRFLAVAGASGLPARLVVNKCDLATSTELADPYRQAGYTVLETSAHNGVGLDRLRAVLDGAVSLLTGPTGVGKSTLLNAMQPGLELKTGAVSRRSRAGRHTTVSAEMLPLGESGFVVDTPGLRDIGLWGLEPAEVAASFPEIARWSAHCRFDNCRHLEEPDCAVAGAAARGEFSSSRLDSYRTLLVEAHRAARPWAGRGTGSGSGGSP